MTWSIDPIRGGGYSGRAAGPGGRKRAEVFGLPVPVGRARTIPPVPTAAGAGAFAAHLLGQEGQKRGLRAGPVFIEAAADLYNQVEWSGGKDRRIAAGRLAEETV